MKDTSEIFMCRMGISSRYCTSVVFRLLLALQWRHDEHDGVSNSQSHDCLLNRSFMRRAKKTSKLRVTGLCEGNSPVTGEFPTQRASNAETVSIWWRHHFKHITVSLWKLRLHGINIIALVLHTLVTNTCRILASFQPTAIFPSGKTELKVDL